MSLTLYKKKRNFKNTPEPFAGIKHKKSTLSFVVQRHAASHLHYDFRLEIEGVLKSWAVPKGPSMKAGEKRLAIMVEDHPLLYGNFYGEIPKGNYGAGIVEIWDKGTYELIENKKSIAPLTEQLTKGDLKFILKGKYLKGAFALVRIHGQEKNWLLIKKDDKYAIKDFNIEEYKPVKPFSINGTHSSHKHHISANKNEQSTTEKIEEVWKSLQKPMLAKLTTGVKDNPEWLYEMKYDGYRVITKINQRQAEMISRNGNSFNTQYMPLVKELEKIQEEVILDGEVVIENEKGISEFQLLQNYTSAHQGILKYYVFDILYLNGHTVIDFPLDQRKELLDDFFQNYKFRNIIKSEFVIGKGEKLFRMLTSKGYEGIIAKEMKSTYTPAKRSNSWLKIKDKQSQEAIICGYTLPQKSRSYFGSLILGLNENRKLKYIGNCGTGFTDISLKQLHQKLEKLTTIKSPFKTKPVMIGSKGKAIWVRPELVCHVKFQNWTQDGRMRIPVFAGLRTDKKPGEVIHEESQKEKTMSPALIGKDIVLNLGGKKIRCTNVDKIYFPDDGITKGDLINYYRNISNYILPYLKDRPLSLNRHPNGINKESFYQKDMDVEQLPAWVKTSKVYSKSNNKYIDYLICNDEATLIYQINLGCIEINPWHSRYSKPDKPDYMMLDLDPGKISFKKVVDTALVIKDICDELQIQCYCKTSGASGLHIYIPLNAKYKYDEIKIFAESLAHCTHKRLPDTTSIERSLDKRKNKIYIDFLQNHKGQTIAAPYCIRPHRFATVSTPLLWKEVNHDLSPQQFTIYTIEQRLKRKGDLWKKVLGKDIDLKNALGKLEKMD